MDEAGDVVRTLFVVVEFDVAQLSRPDCGTDELFGVVLIEGCHQKLPIIVVGDSKLIFVLVDMLEH